MAHHVNPAAVVPNGQQVHLRSLQQIDQQVVVLAIQILPVRWPVPAARVLEVDVGHGVARDHDGGPGVAPKDPRVVQRLESAAVEKIHQIEVRVRSRKSVVAHQDPQRVVQRAFCGQYVRGLPNQVIRPGVRSDDAAFERMRAVSEGVDSGENHEVTVVAQFPESTQQVPARDAIHQLPELCEMGQRIQRRPGVPGSVGSPAQPPGHHVEHVQRALKNFEQRRPRRIEVPVEVRSLVAHVAATPAPFSGAQALFVQPADPGDSKRTRETAGEKRQVGRTCGGRESGHGVEQRTAVQNVLLNVRQQPLVNQATKDIQPGTVEKQDDAPLVRPARHASSLS